MLDKKEPVKLYSDYRATQRNEIIRVFLKSDKYKQSVIQFPIEPRKETPGIQIGAFLQRPKVIRYISNLIRFYTIDFDKKNNQRNNRYSLVLDAPKYENNDQESVSLRDTLPAEHNTESDYFNKLHTFHDLIESKTLYQAYSGLTDKQKSVLDLLYIEGYTVGEIAAMYGQTAQNISNIHRRALQKIRESFI